MIKRKIPAEILKGINKDYTNSLGSIDFEIEHTEIKEKSVKSCQECHDYNTEVCISCPHTPYFEVTEELCPVCGGRLCGDGYTIPRHCENADYPFDSEPDSGPYYCTVPDGIYPKNGD